jgi:hypothetical protein
MEQDHEFDAERTSPDGVVTGRGDALGQDLSACVAAAFEPVIRSASVVPDWGHSPPHTLLQTAP